MGFVDDRGAVVEQLDERRWKLRRALEYQGNTDRYVVPSGTPTDFASVPRIFAWFLPSYGKYTRAAILHDYLWAEASRGRGDWLDADGIFRRAMREEGVEFLRRWIMWAAVRWTALVKKGGRRGWWREAPRAILFGLLGLAIVAVPAVFIAVSLAVFFVLELITWAPLKATSEAKTAVTNKPPRKEVNLPTFKWRTA